MSDILTGMDEMNSEDFEGTAVLEKLAEVGKVDAFYEAIDADDFDRAKLLMKRAGIDTASIAIALRKMRDSDEA